MFFILFLCVALVFGGTPWFQEFVPDVEYYVSATAAAGSGNGSMASPFNLTDVTASRRSRPGALFWLMAGNYQDSDGMFVMKCDGTEDKPCVFRCVPGQRCTLNGVVGIYASYMWLWGMEITDPAATFSGSCPIGVWGNPPEYDDYPGVRVINNYVHDVSSASNFRNGLCAYGETNSLYYGNVLFGEGHGMYVQNRYEQGGYKYFVQNMVMDSRGGGNYVEKPDKTMKKFNLVNGYSESPTHGMGQATGLYFHGNVFSSGRVLVGCGSGIDLGYDAFNVLEKNLFHRARLQLGYGVTSQHSVVHNFIGVGNVQSQFIWGDATTPPQPVSFFGNTILKIWDFESNSHNIAAQAKNGPPHAAPSLSRLRADTQWGGNEYLASFRASLSSSRETLSGMDSAEWKVQSALAGQALDTDSDFTLTVPASRVFFTRNEYELERGHLVVFNFDNASSIAIDLCCLLDADAATSFSLRHYRGLWGTPRAAGTVGTGCSAVSVALGLNEFPDFDAFVLLSDRPLLLPGSNACNIDVVDNEPVTLPPALDTSSSSSPSSELLPLSIY